MSLTPPHLPRRIFHPVAVLSTPSFSLHPITFHHHLLVFSASSPSSPLRRRVFHVCVVPILLVVVVSSSLVSHVDRHHGVFCLVIPCSILTSSNLSIRWRWILHTLVLVGFVLLSFLPSWVWVALVLRWYSPRRHCFLVAGVPCYRPTSPWDFLPCHGASLFAVVLPCWLSPMPGSYCSSCRGCRRVSCRGGRYAGSRCCVAAVELISLLSNPHRRCRTHTVVVGGRMVGVVACRLSLCRRLVLVVALFITLALIIEVRDGED